MFEWVTVISGIRSEKFKTEVYTQWWHVICKVGGNLLKYYSTITTLVLITKLDSVMDNVSIQSQLHSVCTYI